LRRYASAPVHQCTSALKSFPLDVEPTFAQGYGGQALNVKRPPKPGADRMKNLFLYSLLFSTLLWIIMTIAPGEGVAWVGIEFDSRLTAISDPYEAAGGGEGGLWEVSGRTMVSENLGPLDAEIHWLVTTLGSYGDRDLPPITGGNPFRSLDLEDVHYWTDQNAILSELDRLSVTFTADSLSLTAGRQAISWGEAYYYNFGDLFGAFPITETNRLHKTGIDALTATVSLGSFSDLALAAVPSDEGESSAAARLLFPVGQGSMTLTFGSILGADEGGAGYTVDLKGTKLYGTFLLTMPEDADDYTELVIGAERQIGPYTHAFGELYYNSWGTDDPAEYLDLLASRRFLDGQALSLGKWNGAVQVSRQMSALLTITPAVFANLSDGSTLLRMDGAFSLSDLTNMTGGLFIGLGERPDGLALKSEYGNVPLTFYVELVHSL